MRAKIDFDLWFLSVVVGGGAEQILPRQEESSCCSPDCGPGCKGVGL